MSNMYIYGKIVFSRILTEEELINKAFDVIQKSIPYRFGVKFESNSPWDQYELRRKKLICPIAALDLEHVTRWLLRLRMIR